MTGPDPFALPPPSTARLRLLFLTVGAAALFTGYWFLVLGQEGWRDRNQECARLAEVARFLDCSTRVLVLQALAPLAGPALVAVLVLVAYVAAPAVITWRYGAVPLVPWPAAIRATVADAGLPRPPVLMASDRELLLSMFTYGRRPRHRVMVSRSIALHAQQGPATVAALLAHELGHVRNRDVDRSYLALFAVACFVLVTAVPLALSVATTTTTAPAVAVGWRTAVLALLVIGTFAAVVRAREHDADLRAGRIRPAETHALLSGGRAERHRLVRLHPPVDRRREALRDPARLMRPSIAEALTAGVAAGVIVPELGVMLATLSPVPATVAYWLAGLVAAAPVTGVVGLGVWRGALARPRSLAPALASGSALGAGLVAGAYLSPRSSVRWSAWLPGAPDHAAVLGPDRIAPWTALWMVAALLLLTTAIAAWLALTARAWLPRAGVRPWRYLAPFTTVLLAVVMGTWFVAARLAAAERWTPAGIARLVITPQPAFFLAVLVLAAALALWPAARQRLVVAAVAVVVAAAAGRAAVASPTAATSPPAELPRSTQAGAICLGLYQVGSLAYGDPADHTARQRLGALLSDADDPLLRQIGHMFLRSAAARSQDLAAVAWTAFIRRCDHVNRYPSAPVTAPPPPLPTEGW